MDLESRSAGGLPPGKRSGQKPPGQRCLAGAGHSRPQGAPGPGRTGPGCLPVPRWTLPHCPSWPARSPRSCAERLFLRCRTVSMHRAAWHGAACRFSCRQKRTEASSFLSDRSSGASDFSLYQYRLFFSTAFVPQRLCGPVAYAIISILRPIGAAHEIALCGSQPCGRSIIHEEQ